jgi:hypothetical protein
MDGDTEKMLRVLILDSLVARSGRVLVADMIGEITTEILERVTDEYKRRSKNAEA